MVDLGKFAKMSLLWCDCKEYDWIWEQYFMRQFSDIQFGEGRIFASYQDTKHVNRVTYHRILWPDNRPVSADYSTLYSVYDYSNPFFRIYT